MAQPLDWRKVHGKVFNQWPKTTQVFKFKNGIPCPPFNAHKKLMALYTTFPLPLIP
jgi:hypothetical protein